MRGNATTAAQRAPRDHGEGLTARLTWLRAPWAPVLAFAGLALIAFGLILHVGRGAGFGGDQWDLMLGRQGSGAGTFLRPHVEHLYALHVLLSKVVTALFGLRPAPFRVVLDAVHVTTAALLFVFARRRVGGWLALALSAVFLFLGAGAESIIVPAQIGLDISYAAGIAALLALDGRGRASRIAACALLLLSLVAGTGVLFFIAGIAIWFVMDRTRRRDLWIPAIPLLVYAWWVLAWRLSHGSPQITKNSLLLAPHAFLDFASAGFAAVVGAPEAWGAALFILAFIALVRVYRPDPRLTAILALAPVSWLATALVRSANVSRYTYVSVLLILLALAEVLGRVGRIRLRDPLVAGLAVFSVAANTALLFSYGTTEREQEQKVAPQVMAVDTAGAAAAPAFALRPIPWFGHFRAGTYFSFVKDVPGSAYHGADRIRRLPPSQRQLADATLIRAERVQLRPATGARTHRCTTTRAPIISIQLPRSGLVIAARDAPVTVRIRRFAPALQPHPVGTVAPHQRAFLLTLPDSAPDPWQLQIAGSRRAVLCRGAG